MNNTKLNIFKVVVIIINLIGIGILSYFSVKYFSFDNTVPNPDAMLPVTASEAAGFSVLLGIIPMIIANICLFVSLKKIKTPIRLLFFVPSIVCIFVGIHYLFIGPYKMNTKADTDNYAYDVKIELKTDDQIYGLAFDYEKDNKIFQSGVVSEPNYSVLEGPVYFRLTEADFSDYGNNYDGLTMYICVYNSADEIKLFEDTSNIEKIKITPQKDKQVTYSLVGNKEQGYQLKIEQ